MSVPVLLSVPSLAPEQRARLASTLFAERRPALEGGVALLATLALCFWRTPWPGYAALAVLAAAFVALRLILRRAYLAAQLPHPVTNTPPVAPRPPEEWAGRFAVGVCGFSLLWGLTSLCVLLRGADPQLQLLVLLAQAGWLGGAAVRNAASPAAVIGQSLCALLPTLLGLLLMHPGLTQIAIALVLFQLVATLAIARFLGAQIVTLMLSEQRLAAAHAQLLRLSAQDSLTGIANRRGFDTALRVEWARAAREASDIALLMIDVDHFDAYNKLHRTLAGDECLRRLGAILADTVRRPTDLAARFSGAMFAALLPGTSEAGARDVAERLRAAVEQAAMPHNGSPCFVVTVSIGVASMAPQPGTDAKVLITLADRALCDAKKAGRNQVRGANARLPLGNWNERRRRRLARGGEGGSGTTRDEAATGETMPAALADLPHANIPPGLRVLVLEDDGMVAMLLKDMLGELGCQVLGPFDTTAAALQWLQQDSAQVALLDVHLPGGQDGFAVAETLATNGVPFAFVTGDGGASLPPELADRPVLHKPFHLATMVNLVAHLAQLAAA